jgi:hypothetical protein
MYSLFTRISNDLNINKLSIETNEQFYSRLVYSSLSYWIKISAVNIDNEGVSKKYIINNVTPFLKTILEIHPELNSWFYSYENKVNNPITLVRKRLYESGELTNMEFTSNLTLANFQSVKCKGLEIYRGNIEFINNYTGGLASYKGIGILSDIDVEKLFEFYFIDDITAKRTLEIKVDSINWTKENKKDSEIFNPNLKEPLSKGFSKDYNLKDGEISLYRENFSDYGFVKNYNNEYYISHLSDFEIKTNEVRRFQYALKNLVRNNQIANYKVLEHEQVVTLHLYSALPKKEESILFLFGWPINNISDNFNFIFNLSIWNLIKKILENLHISLIEEA